MRRIVALATLIALAATLIVPVAALAKGGPPAGKGPGFTPPGQAKKAVAPVEPSAAEETEEPAEETPATNAKEAGKAAGLGKAAGKVPAHAAEAIGKAAGAEDVADTDEAVEGTVSAMEETVTPEPEEGEEPEEEEADKPSDTGKMFGIANALSRIMANIERAEAKVAAGQKSQVPPGLLKVMAKFLGWLGFEAEPELDTEEPGTEEPGLTDPGEGSEEETSTPNPDEGSEEDTVTIEPELEE
jgi:hypothetical protein